MHLVESGSGGAKSALPAQLFKRQSDQVSKMDPGAMGNIFPPLNLPNVGPFQIIGVPSFDG